MALQVAVSAHHAVHQLGLPEGRLPLTEAAIYLAAAPKSNSVTRAMGRARSAVEGSPGAQVPQHLRDAHYPGAKTLGHGAGYRYPHNYEGNIVQQSYLPEELEDQILFVPGSEGEEARIGERLLSWDRRLGRPDRSES